MKIKYAVIIPILLFICMNCSAQVEIGKSIDSFKIVNSDSALYILTSPAQFEKGYDIIFDSIVYRVALMHKTIKFIATTDLKFKTPEGAFIGMAYSSIDLKKAMPKIMNLSGWGKVLKFHSGWNAVFDFREPLKDSSLIQFFYKKE